MIHDSDFQHLVCEHAKEIMQYLIDQNMAFSILCNIKKVTFSPLLPALNQLPEFSLFVLVGYTFESIELGDDFLCFEAGFGEKNEGSVVRVPLNAIIQIFLHHPQPSSEQEGLLFVNLLASLDDPSPPQNSNRGVEDSMRTFLQNPENQHLKK